MNLALFRLPAAFGLGAAAGLNATMPLAIVSILAHLHFLTLAAPFNVLGSSMAMWSLVVLAVVEMALDKLPGLSTLGHALLFPLSVAAGAILFAVQVGAVTSVDPGLTIVMGLLAGGATAGIIHTVRGGLRPVLHLALIGSAVSLTEDILAGILTGAALFAPVLVPFILLGLLIILVLLIRRLARFLRTLFKSFFKWFGWSSSANSSAEPSIAPSALNDDLNWLLEDEQTLSPGQHQRVSAPGPFPTQPRTSGSGAQQQVTGTTPSTDSLDFFER